MVDLNGWSTVAIRKRLKHKLGLIQKRTRQNPTRQVEMAVERYIETMAEDPEIAQDLQTGDKPVMAKPA